MNDTQPETQRDEEVMPSAVVCVHEDLIPLMIPLSFLTRPSAEELLAQEEVLQSQLQEYFFQFLPCAVRELL